MVDGLHPAPHHVPVSRRRLGACHRPGRRFLAGRPRLAVPRHARGLHFEPGRNTWWAPELIFADGVYHLYPSYIQGVPDTWNRPRRIVHYTSRDLWHWQYEGALSLSSDRVIDACVARISPELWRMWYKDERTIPTATMRTAPISSTGRSAAAP